MVQENAAGRLAGGGFTRCLLRLAQWPEVVCLFLPILTLAAFWPVTQHGFISYDDPEYVTSNPFVQAGLSWRGVVWAFGTFHASNWHPLTWLSHMLDANLFGNHAGGPHAVNLAFHIANAILLFLTLRRMTGAHWRPAMVAALFALHPLHVESVAWVAERKDFLCTFFWMLTLWAYARYAEQGHRSPTIEGRNPKEDRTSEPEPARRTVYSTRYYALALVLFALGLMSKPMLVTLPFVLLLLDYWPLQRFQLQPQAADFRALVPLVREKVPFLLLSAIAVVVTLLAQHRAMQPLLRLPLGVRIENAFVSYARYLARMIRPADLALPYPHPGHWPWLDVVLAASLVAGFCVVALLAARGFPFVFTGWFWFLGVFVPVIGLVQVGDQAMADRYTYVPLVGMFLLLVWAAGRMAEQWHPAKAQFGGCAVVVLTVLGALSWRQSGLWRNDETLFRHALTVTDSNYIALGNVGLALFDQRRFDEPIDYFTRSLQINPSYVDVINNMGAALARKGDAAAEWFRKALITHPDSATGWRSGGTLCRALLCHLR